MPEFQWREESRVMVQDTDYPMMCRKLCPWYELNPCYAWIVLKRVLSWCRLQATGRLKLKFIDTMLEVRLKQWLSKFRRSLCKSDCGEIGIESGIWKGAVQKPLILSTAPYPAIPPTDMQAQFCCVWNSIANGVGRVIEKYFWKIRFKCT